MATLSENPTTADTTAATEAIQPELPVPEPVVRRHSIDVGGTTLHYTTTSGYMGMKDDRGKHLANIFYVAYTLDDSDAAHRPMTFAFNGGPGSSSVWLHLGALGPRMVQLGEHGEAPPPPYRLIDNPHTWLAFTDLVFIDPVGTGYSRPAGEEKREQFHGVEEDIASVGEFIRLYTTLHRRWLSPKFLAGESYGTTRAAGLADRLQQRYGMYLNGVLLISTVLHFQTLHFLPGNDQPYLLYIPAYTATAWYHGRLADSLQHRDLRSVLHEVRRWCTTEYLLALAEGDALMDDRRRDIARTLAHYTGLPELFILRANLRIALHRFVKELLRSEHRTVGRLDSRFKGIDRDAAGEEFDYDPSYEGVILGPFTAALNEYMRADLGFESELTYEILSMDVHPWNWGSAEQGFTTVAEHLRRAMTRNPFLKVFVANGYYDLATPFPAVEYTMNHLGVDATLRGNITMAYYAAGHMMYIQRSSREQLYTDAEQFVREASGTAR